MKTPIIRHNFFLLAYLLCLLSLLSGCVSTIHTPKNLITLNSEKNIKQPFYKPHSFEANGKVGFSDGKRGGNGSIEWQQMGEKYKIRLYGPLGSGSLQINGDNENISLVKEDGKISYAKNPEILVQKELGWTIPVSGLRYWIIGNPAPGKPPKLIQIDEDGRLWHLEQQGWTITYQGYQTWQNQDVPTKLILKNGPLRLKFILNYWELNP